MLLNHNKYTLKVSAKARRCDISTQCECDNSDWQLRLWIVTGWRQWDKHARAISPYKRVNHHCGGFAGWCCLYYSIRFRCEHTKNEPDKDTSCASCHKAKAGVDNITLTLKKFYIYCSVRWNSKRSEVIYLDLGILWLWYPSIFTHKREIRQSSLEIMSSLVSTVVPEDSDEWRRRM